MTVRPGPIDLFWTGGWDSTFRLLQILLVEGGAVQPHYIVDPRRRSTPDELRACAAIREALRARDTDASARLLPTRERALGDIRPDDEVSHLYRTLDRRSALGSQGEWLALYAREQGLDAIEICWEASDRPAVLVPMILREAVGEGHDRRLPEVLDEQVLEFLRPFRFPISHLTKAAMGELAARHGFADLMGLTWFCHKPKGGRPCGVCIPCEYVEAAGLGWRLPLRARWRLARARRRGTNPIVRRLRRHARAHGLPDPTR